MKMNRLNLKYLLFILALLTLAFSAAAKTQNLQKPPPGGLRPGQIIRQLNLTREQLQQIRRINQERKPIMRAAHDRLRDANRNLDRAIYADTIDDAEIQNRLKEVQLAQAEVIKLRNQTELEIRKILTAEQIVKFRQLREEFERRMDERRMEDDDDLPPQDGDEQPNKPVNNRPFKERRQNRQNF